MSSKPSPIIVDGEIFKVEEVPPEEREDIGIKGFARGPRLNISPYEAELLRDWLTRYLEWYNEG